ncbi:MAG: hypothetical protein AAFO57_03780 [Pseudomonadota bacterium]
MRKLIALTVAGAALAAPALAATMTVEFTPSEGEAVSITMSDDGTYTGSDGTAGTYTWDADSQTLCGTSDAGTLCATFEGEASDEPAVGDTRAYTADNGSSGTATVTAIEE